jgi:hypothetical protein
MAPLVATTLIRETRSLAAPGLLMAGCAVLTLIGTFSSTRYGGNVLVPGRQNRDAVQEHGDDRLWVEER